MVFYYKTQQEAKEAANDLRSKNKGSYINESSYQCECGQSFAVHLYDRHHVKIAIFVECEACHEKYK